MNANEHAIRFVYGALAVGLALIIFYGILVGMDMLVVAYGESTVRLWFLGSIASIIAVVVIYGIGGLIQQARAAKED